MNQPFTLMYGTAWKEDRTAELTLAALRAGFRAIDTANQRRHYHEAGVGEGLARAYDAGLVERSDVYLQTKFTFQAGQDHRLPYDPAAAFPDQVRQSFASSLQHLRTDQLDCLVLHGPSSHPALAEADWQVWTEMEALQREGLVRSIGVSNVGPSQLDELCRQAAIKPAWVQSRVFANRGWNAHVRAVAATHDVRFQGFSLLTANRPVWNHAEVAAIAQRVDATPAQVIFRFAIELGMVPLTGTTDSTHMALDLRSWDVALTDADIQTIRALGS